VAHRRHRARRGDGALLRDELLAAATTLLVETGSADAVTIRAVAALAGCAPPSVYLHFPDKDALVFAVSQQQFLRLDEAVEAAADAHTDPLDRLRARARAYVRFGLDHPEHYRVLFMGHADDTPDFFDDTSMLRAASFAYLVENVRACLDAGVFRPELDPLRTAFGLWALVHGLTSLKISKPTVPWPPTDELVDDLCDAHVRGLLA